MATPTFPQMQEFFRQVEAGKVTSKNLQDFLRNPDRFLSGGKTNVTMAKTKGFKVTYDQSLGLRPLIERAVGSANLGNINSNITQERFPLAGSGKRRIKARVEAFLPGETAEQAAIRLVAAGFKLANTGDLAAFLHDHPEEVDKWFWVFAVSEDSRWAHPAAGHVYVPYAYVSGAYRRFDLDSFRDPQDSDYGVLVLCE